MESFRDINDKFISNLYFKLDQPDQTAADKVAKQAIFQLSQALSKRDDIHLENIDITHLTSIADIETLDDHRKKIICGLVAKLVLGSRFDAESRARFDLLIDNAVDQQSLNRLVHNVVIMKNMISSGKEVSQGICERILSESQIPLDLVEIPLFASLSPDQVKGIKEIIAHIGIKNFLESVKYCSSISGFLMKVLTYDEPKNVERKISTEILESLETMDLNTAISVVKNMRKNLNEGALWSERDILLNLFSQCPENKHVALTRYMKILISNQVPEYNTLTSINKITGENDDDWDQIITVTEPFIESYGDESDALVEAFQKVPPEEREDVAKWVQLLTKDKNDEVNFIIRLINELGIMNKTDREQIIPLLQQHCVTAKSFGYAVIALYKVLPKDREAVMRSVNLIPAWITKGDLYSIIDTLRRIPLQDHRDVIEHFNNLIEEEGVNIRSNIDSVLKEIHKVPPNGRGAVIRAVKLLRRGRETGAYLQYLIKRVAADLSSNLERYARKANELLGSGNEINQGVPQSLEAMDFVLSIPLKDLDDIVDFVIASNFPFDKQQIPIIRKLRGIPEKERLDILHFVKDLTLPKDEKILHGIILTSILELPKEERAEIYDLAVPYLKMDMNGRFYIKQVFSEIQMMPKAQRSKILKEAAVLCGTPFSILYLILFCETLREVPPHLLDDTINRSLALHLHFTNEPAEGMAELIRTVGKIPLEERDDLMQQAIRFFPDLNGPRVTGTLDSLRLAPKDERDEVITLAKGFLQIDAINSTTLEVMKAIAPLSPSEREEVLRQALLLEGTIANGQHMKALQVVLCMKKEDRAELIPMIVTFIQKVKNFDLIKVLLTVPKEKLQEIMDKTVNYMEPSKSFDRIKFLELILLLPEDQLTEENLQLCKAACSIPNVSVDNVKFVAPQHLIAFLNHLKQGSGNFSLPVFMPPHQHFYNGLPEDIRDASLAYLSERLDKVKDDRGEAFRLTSEVIKLKFIADEDHPVMQKVIELYVLSNPEKSDDPKNCYVIFNTLRRLSEPLVACQMPEQNGMRVNLETLREGVNASPLTVEDLPKVNKELLRKLLNGLKDDARSEKVEKYLQEYGLDLKRLEGYLFGFSAVVNGLLKRDIKAGEISSTLYYLYCIIDSVSRLSSEPGKSDLSPQEERLIAFAYSLSECSTGQNDGIALFYNETVPLDLRTRKKEGREAAVEALNALVNTSVQACLNSILADEELLKKETGNDNPQQLSHQTMYLKNRLHKQLGLQHSVTFDVASRVLYDVLLEKTTEQLLEPIVQRLTPENVIAAVREDFNRSLMKQQKMSAPILEFLQKEFQGMGQGEIFAPAVEEDDYRKILQHVKYEGEIEGDLEELFDDFYRENKGIREDPEVVALMEKKDKYLLTEVGVQRLLQAFNYLLVSKPQS